MFLFIEFFDEPCKFDYLLVRDKEHNNEVLGRFCGNSIPSPIISKSNSLWVTMITDGQDNKAGFRASWEIQEQEPEGKTTFLLSQILPLSSTGPKVVFTTLISRECQKMILN